MQKRIISVMIMMLLAVVSINAADNKLPRIAVVEFNINNAENYGLRHDALTVRDLVQSNIVKSGRYDVIAREEIDKLLENEKIAMSEISSSENIKKLRLHNVSYIVTGSVNVSGYDYIVCVNMLDVAIGKIIYSDDELMNSSSSAMYQGTKTLVNRFLKMLGVENGNEIAAINSSIAPSGFVFVEGNNKVSSFYICDHEVTQAEYHSVTGESPSYFSGDDKPVEGVSWYSAVEYCNKLSRKEGLNQCYSKDSSGNWTWNRSANGYRLPTEAEWEYAAKGGRNITGYRYSGSDNIDGVAWYDKNAYDVGSNSSAYGTHPVKHKAPNELGIYDMTGNVWEWCWDWWENELPTNPSKDYAGPSSGNYRVIRGGGWSLNADDCSVSYRGYIDPCYWYRGLGFRVACSVSR